MNVELADIRVSQYSLREQTTNYHRVYYRRDMFGVASEIWFFKFKAKTWKYFQSEGRLSFDPDGILEAIPKKSLIQIGNDFTISDIAFQSSFGKPPAQRTHLNGR